MKHPNLNISWLKGQMTKARKTLQNYKIKTFIVNNYAS